MCSKGKVYLVGIGPGSPENVTPKALKALKNSQTVLGHSKHLDLIKEHIAGKRVITEKMSPIERSEVAVKEALKGRNVAIVSTGDPGIYAIASIFFQHLKEEGIDLDVEVVPGITAAGAAAALLGSPLGHDFASISLGDLAIPWEVIERRLEAASEADFVLVLYNPISKEGDWQLRRALQIIGGHRGFDTEVGMVTDATRVNEKVVVTTLGEMLSHHIDVETIIIVGNSETYLIGERIVTPKMYEEGVGY